MMGINYLHLKPDSNEIALLKLGFAPDWLTLIQLSALVSWMPFEISIPQNLSQIETIYM